MCCFLCGTKIVFGGWHGHYVVWFWWCDVLKRPHRKLHVGFGWETWYCAISLMLCEHRCYVEVCGVEARMVEDWWNGGVMDNINIRW